MTIGGPNKGHTSNWTYFQPGAVSVVWSGGCKVITPPWNRPCFQRIINLDNNMFISNKQCDHFQGYWVMYMTSHIPIKEVIYFLTWSFITFYGYSNFSDFWGHLKYLMVIVFFFCKWPLIEICFKFFAPFGRDSAPDENILNPLNMDLPLMKKIRATPLFLLSCTISNKKTKIKRQIHFHSS